ncbi:MAG TPA: hypothetical protein VFX12_00985 [Vicinamibacterales bacterium]|nr:hypothetical protein [Vicinamibacterales bacterium]
MAQISASSYGGSRVRLLRLFRRGDRDDPRDLAVGVRFEGDFSTAFREGVPEGIIPAETLTRLVQRVAREQPSADLEPLGLALCARILDRHPHVGRVRVEIVERPWTRVQIGGKAQGQTFTDSGAERRLATVTSNGTRAAVVAGLEQLVLMRTTGFAPPRRKGAPDEAAADGLQTLLVVTLGARWRYAEGDLPFALYREGARLAILETFARHAARTLQHTLYAIADVLLATYQEIAEVTLTAEERPYRPADLFEEGLENPDEVFVARDEPLGVVEVTVTRSAAASSS